MRKALVVLGACAGLAFAAGLARAEEGFWTFDNFPAEAMRENHGWAPDAAWLARAMTATARLPSCSGVVVSGEGLLLTNQHCVVACLAQNSDIEHDLVRGGHIARTREQELRCPSLPIDVLESVADVTQRIEAAAEARSGDPFAQVRDAEIARIVAGCAPQRRCDVIALYEGGRYALYTYRRYDDVRLAFAPDYAMAQFGAPQRNFEFPRTSFDFALLRLYANGAPARTQSHLRLRFSAPVEGESVLAAGNPGPTSRLRTMAELVFERDVAAPWRQAALEDAEARLAAFAARGADEARLAAEALENVANVADAYRGRRAALADQAGLIQIAEAEADLVARVARNAASQREAGEAWDEIADAYAAYRAFYYTHQLLEARAGERSDLFLWARDIVRGASERGKPEGARLPRYTGASMTRIAAWVEGQRAVRPDWEAVNLEIWLTQIERALSREDPVLARQVLRGRTAQALAAELSASRLIDPAYRSALWRDGAVAVAASDDPMLVFVRDLDAAARAARLRFEAEVEGPVARARERIARVRFRAFGDSLYPEATFSPRLAYGRVVGWREGEANVGPFTFVRDLAGQLPPGAWASALDATMVVNFTSSTDIISGNSGSALLDRDGRVLGVVFDGNRASLGGEYYYDAMRNRAISVSAQAIGATLSLHGLDALAGELGAPL